MNCAQAIRKELKEKFPNIKFSVRSERDTVRISYTNAVPSKQIEDVVGKYEYGHFNGMEDIYEYSNTRDDIPQVKYVFVTRHVTEDIYKKVAEDIARDYALENPEDDQVWFKKFGFWKDSVVGRKVAELTI